MASKLARVGISCKRDIDGCYRVAWKDADGCAGAQYAATFGDAVRLGERMMREWRAIEREVTRDLGN